MITAQIVGRMAAPGSERATWAWLNHTSALEELLGLSFADLSVMRLYRAADTLLKHQEAIESHLFDRACDLFDLDATVTLYDLTNTYFEGQVSGNGKARRGKSKEKRTDCPLVTLGLVLDGSGFVRRSRVFAGNAVEWRSLEEMLSGLSAPPGALVVMDRGLATDANIEWLREHGYRYIVVSREATRIMPQGETLVETAGGDSVRMMKVIDEAAGKRACIAIRPSERPRNAGSMSASASASKPAWPRLRAGLEKPRGTKQPQARA